MSLTPTPIDPLAAYDWCGACMRLQAALEKVVSGGGVTRVRHVSGGEERDTDFSPGNAAELRRALVEAKENCAKQLSGGRSRRFAIQGGQYGAPMGPWGWGS